ncbi:MAG: radical SAM protein [Acidobacteria bacterium]|nr:radical SAM protein [Acidobacteriota bacterium]
MAQKILFISHDQKGFLGLGYMPPVGIGSLAEYLEHKGLEYMSLDMRLSQDIRKVDRCIQEFRPDFVGLTVFSLHYFRAYEIVEFVKTQYPHIKTIIGGAHATTLREELFDECPGLDYVGTFEGEHLLEELLEGKPPEEILGLIYRGENGRPVFSGERPLIRNLDALPFPRYTRFDLSKYLKKTIGILTSRGCPYDCTFCPVPEIIGKTMRYKSPEYLVEEIDYWYRRDYRDFDIWDDNFTIHRRRVFEICEKLLAKGYKDIVFNLPNGVRADRVDREMLMLMKRAGFRGLAYGVEGGNDRILTLIKKAETLEEIETAVALSCELGFEVVLFFILGMPGETREDVEDSIALAQKYPIARVNFYNPIPFPRTEMYDHIVANNLLRFPKEDYLNRIDHFLNEPIFATPDLAVEARRELYAKGQQVSRQIYRNHMRRQLRSFGWAGRLTADLVSSGFAQSLHDHESVVRAANVAKRFLRTRAAA